MIETDQELKIKVQSASGQFTSTFIDPRLVPQHVLYTGARMPAVGLGTFSSDRVSASEITAKVEDAAAVGYRHFDCASVYGNESEIGYALRQVMQGQIKRKELWITSKLWNGKHGENDVIPSCRKSLEDLRVDYLDLYLLHWPFPNFHPPGFERTSRNTEAQPYLHAEFMGTWRKMEESVDLGRARHIGVSKNPAHVEVLLRLKASTICGPCER